MLEGRSQIAWMCRGVRGIRIAGPSRRVVRAASYVVLCAGLSGSPATLADAPPPVRIAPMRISWSGPSCLATSVRIPGHPRDAVAVKVLRVFRSWTIPLSEVAELRVLSWRKVTGEAIVRVKTLTGRVFEGGAMFLAPPHAQLFRNLEVHCIGPDNREFMALGYLDRVPDAVSALETYQVRELHPSADAGLQAASGRSW